MATGVRPRPPRRPQARRQSRRASAGGEPEGGDDAPVALSRDQFERLLKLAQLAEPGLEIVPVRLRFVGEGERDRHLIGLARAIHRLRRRRELYFDTGLFSDPAWDLLLHLYVATGEDRPLDVSRACRAAAVPTTTALRWLSRLEADGLVQRRSDPLDARRVKVGLTAEAMRTMRRLFGDIQLMLETDPEPGPGADAGAKGERAGR